MAKNQARYVVVVGGVISGVGKGVTTASIGRILQEHGYSVTAVKIDPYINYDAGTLRPTEHGEVWVTDDGGEIDQDLGNYERFLELNISRRNNITTGQVYKKVIDDERAGKYLGKTVQFIPHIPDEIKRRVKEASNGYDFCLVEIGGTVGDYENIPYLFAMKSLEREVGKEGIVYVLVTYLPVPSHIDEMKTKPTQQSIKLLTEQGVIPDFIVCRAKKALDEVRKGKIETYANIKSDHVISEPDIDTIYRIPLDLEKEDFGVKLLKEFGMKPRKKPDWKNWEKLVNSLMQSRKEVRIAMVCKYADIGDFTLADSYISINQSLQHAGAHLGVKVKIEWIDSKKFEKDPKTVIQLKNYGGIIVPGGFGESGVEGKIIAINYARENKIPYLGLCYGMQLAVVEFARNVCGMKGAHTTEINKTARFPVIDILPEQRKNLDDKNYGASMRLGAYYAKLKKGSIVQQLYGQDIVSERHRHRWEVNREYVSTLEKNGLVISGMNEEKNLVEFIELPKSKHPYFVATQAHPEFKSRFMKPAPLFVGLVKAAMGK